jgi:two-component system response regulator RegX3
MTYDCLIIDDEKLLADSTAEYFNLFGVKTALAYSASDCRNFFKEWCGIKKVDNLFSRIS